MRMNRNYRRIDGNCREIDLIRGSLILPLIFNVELQSYIYRRLALMSLAHMTQDNWLVNSTCAL